MHKIIKKITEFDMIAFPYIAFSGICITGLSFIGFIISALYRHDLQVLFTITLYVSFLGTAFYGLISNFLFYDYYCEQSDLKRKTDMEYWDNKLAESRKETQELFDRLEKEKNDAKETT